MNYDELGISLEEASLSRRKLLQLTGGGLLAMLAAGCGGSGGGGSSGGSSGVTVLASSGQRWEIPVRAELPLFAKAHPKIPVRLNTIPHDEFETKVLLVMNSHAENVDVVFSDYGHTPAFSNIKAAVPLQPYLDRDPKWRDDYLKDVPASINKLYRAPMPDGPIYGIAGDGNSQLNFYRTDLFEKAGIKVPETWPDVIATARELTDKKRNQYGFITTAQRGLFAGLQMWAIMASYGGTWFDREEKGGWHPQFSSDAGFRALQTFKALMPYAHPVTMNASDDQANQALAQGTAVYGPVEWGTSTLTDPKFTKFADVFGTGTTPRGETAQGVHRPLMGGMGFFLPAASKNKDAAWEFIKWCASGDLSDAAIGKAWVGNTGQPARISLLTQYEKEKPYFKGLAEAFPTAVPSTPVLPQGIELTIAIGNETAKVLADGKDVDTALKDMDKAVTTIMTKSGYYKD